MWLHFEIESAILNKTKFEGTDLTDADFTMSAMDETNLTGAKCVRTRLIRIDLATVNVSRKDLKGAIIEGCVCRKKTFLYQI